ncbi:hypothetical protein [Chelativorans sp. AA-79]|uniref:hypothetical protein n=1 Tax=Chelativorans sp. AA-79 TaxID=3028735 RepID=UPI0023F76922|nr:hypothetical protein [Chelativorans sp. AA-79]WEX11407.1 hypothetical protein PVE73_10985 [Chelativorans sp. AA-79]
MPAEKASQGQGRKPNDSTKVKETDLANDRMGRNSLQGDDQESVRNERHAQPDNRTHPDEVMESFTKMDKDKRARSDLGKGNRSGK